MFATLIHSISHRLLLGRFSALAALWLLIAGNPETAFAVNSATGPDGAQIDIVKLANTYNLSGAGVNLGQVETGRPGDADNPAGGPAEINHPNVNPAGGNIGVSHVAAGPVITFPATANTNLDAHATQVAGAMISNHGTFRGAAHSARLFSSAYVFTGAGTQDEAIVASEWVRSNTTPIINFSFGKGITNAEHPAAPAVRDGRSLLSMYVDYTARERNVLFVQSGPETGAILNSTPDDAYNNVVVGYTARGPSGRFDRINNGSLTNMVQPDGGGAANRSKVDLVAPGTNLVLPQLGGAFTRDTFNDANGNGVWNSIFVDNNVSGGFDAVEPFIDLNGNGVYNAATEPYFESDFNGVRNDAVNADFYTNASEAVNDVDADLVVNFQVSGTSYAAPLVAGTAALLRQYAVGQSGVSYALVEKVTLLNAASKHVRDRNGVDWSTSYNLRNANPQQIAQPLDRDLGLGQLNGLATIRQYDGGNSHRGVSLMDVAAGTNPVSNLFVGGGPLEAGSLVTATITWDRVVGNAAGNLTNLASYASAAPPNLSLELVDRSTGAVVARSNSAMDNVEHIYFNVRSKGDYDLRINNPAGGAAARVALALNAGSTNGLTFSVGRNAEGNMRDKVNDVSSLGQAGPAAFATEGEIFTSGQDGRNMQRISGALQTLSRVGPHNSPPAALTTLDDTGTTRGVLGLRPGDNLNSISYGTDGTAGQKSVLAFSVSPTSVGKLGTDVHFQAVLSPGGPAALPPLPANPGLGDAGHEAAGDIFKSPRLDQFGAYASRFMAPAPVGSNALMVDESALGLQAPATNGRLLNPVEDDLDALEFDSPLSVDPDGDGMHNLPIYFTLDGASPSNPPANGMLSNILLSRGPDNDASFNLMPNNAFGFEVFARGVNDIGLALADVIDGLILSDASPLDIGGPEKIVNMRLDPGVDEALFSLAPGNAAGVSGADVFFTDFSRPFDPTKRWDQGGSLFATASELGLLASDNIDALDIFQVPEPGAWALLFAAFLLVPRLNSCRERVSRAVD